MKRIITPLAALISLMFIPTNWVYLSPKLPVGGFGFVYYSIKNGAVGGYFIIGLAIIALILIALSLILKNSARIFAVIGLSSAAIMLLLIFGSFGGDPYSRNDQTAMAVGWYGSLICFLTALLGGGFLIETKIRQLN